MHRLLPPRLRKGSQLRVVAPALSLAIVDSTRRQIAIERLESLGLKISFGAHVEERNRFNSSSIESRISDLHAAFEDKGIHAVMTQLGGFNSHQLLDYLDFDLIAANPKVFCGFSDITALSNAILARTGLVTYSGPHFTTFSMVHGVDYTVDWFRRMTFEDGPFEVPVSETWSDDQWHLNQENREFLPNPGCLVLQPGKAEGRIVGGNIGTLALQFGTRYLPSLEDSILFVEDDNETKPQHLDRVIQSLIHQPGSGKIRGILIGRFQKASGISDEVLAEIIRGKRELRGIPIIANASFGHCTPQFTFPIGGFCRIQGHDGSAKVLIGSSPF